MSLFTTIWVSKTLRDDLTLLKEIRNLKSVELLIRKLLEAQLYNEEFFERIREKVVS